MGVHLSKNWKKKGSIFNEDLFFVWSLPEFGEKSVPFAYFWHSLNFSKPEQNCGRGSSLPMLKIRQNWGKIANYPP